ncbi:MAG: type II and III secretion system protein family protein [Pseudomonadota bacterium]
METRANLRALSAFALLALAGDARALDGGPSCNGQAGAPTTLALHVGKSSLMHLPEAIHNRSVGNPAVVQAMLVAPDTLYVVGADIGSTNMIIQGKSGSCSIVDVVVSMDPRALQAALAAALPDEKGIKVQAAADTLVLTGTVADGAAIARAQELAGAFVRRPVQSLNQKDDKNATTGSGPRVVNLLALSASQQVMLEVKIAEVSKSLLEKLEANATLRLASGSWAATLMSNFLTGTLRGHTGLSKSNGNSLALDAQKEDGLVRILAEPTVMAISGQEGSFLAGGKIFIPVAQDNNKVTLEEKEFGVGLRFTPTVFSGGRINLRVAPEVSEVSREGVGISAAGFAGGAVLPLITTRRASTTVQLLDGQSFAIGGLIKNNLTTSIKAVPLLGDVPILGALFRSTDFQQDRTELVFVVTAHLVKPLAADYALPTDTVVAPTRAELMLGGRLEGRASTAPQDSARRFELK